MAEADVSGTSSCIEAFAKSPENAVADISEESTWMSTFQAAVASFLGDATYTNTSPRIALARECAATLQERQDDAALRTFVESLGDKLSDIFARSLGVTTLSHSKRREKMWVLFYEFRSCELRHLWNKLVVQQLKLPKYKDPWLIQVLTRLCLERSLSVKYPLPSHSDPDRKHLQLTADEHNALRYAAGYVLQSMKKKFPSLVTWIERQTDNSVAGSSYMQFTKLWVEKVNRGGLFLISDSVYELFLTMELVLRQFLQSMSENHGLEKVKVVDILCKDNEVQFYWSMMTFDLDEDTSQMVLMEVTKLWVTIRGFSYASTIVEEYKRLSGVLKRTKSLRKELKKQSSDTSDQL